jgi:hypothetical protein
MSGVGVMGMMTMAVEEGGMVGDVGGMAGAVEDSGKGSYVKCGMERGVCALVAAGVLRLHALDAVGDGEGEGVAGD